MEVYKKWLRENGYQFDVKPFGITFRHQGGNFIISDNEGVFILLAILLNVSMFTEYVMN